MSNKVSAPSIYEIKSAFTDSLRRIAINPSIYGYIAQPHQEPFHRSKAKGRLFLGGNRAGKTVAECAEAVMRLTGKHKYRDDLKRPPIAGRSVSVDVEKGIKEIVLPQIARWMPPSELINGSWEDSYAKGERKLTLANGSTLEFMTYEQEVEKFAGTSRDFVMFDEEPPEDIFNENLLRLVDVNGDWWMAMTPLIDMSWTHDRLFQKGLDPATSTLVLPDGTSIRTVEVFQASSLDNQYISEAELFIATDGMSEEEADARKHGKYFSYTGAIYSSSIRMGENGGIKTFIPPIHNSDSWPLLYNKWGHFGMLDHGYSNPTAFYLGAYDKYGRVIIYYEYYKQKKLVHENAEAIKGILRELRLENKLEYIVGDPSIRNTDPITGSSIQQEYAEHGLYIGLANNDVIGGINRVSSRLKKGMLLITDNCEMAKWEFVRYRWAKYDTSKARQKNNAKETPMKKDDHAMDAIRYGIVSRPELDGEHPMRAGNPLNAPMAIVNGEMFDYEVQPDFMKSQQMYDSTLGTDW